VMLPTMVPGRLLHYCAVYNVDFSLIDQKDVKGKKVGVLSRTKTTGL